MAAALSGHLDAGQAAEAACRACAEALEGAHADLVTVFFSGHHLGAAATIARTVRERLEPRCLIGASAEAVVGGEIEMEQVPGVSVLVATLPGATLTPFNTDQLLPIAGNMTREELEPIAKAAGLTGDHRATILLGDPFSVPTNALLPAMAAARDFFANPRNNEDERPGPIIGGMASAAQRAGGNALFLNDKILRAGAVGVSIAGPVRVDAIVSQGCKPIGPPLVITAGKGQMISTLGGKPAVQVLSGILDTLDGAGKQRLKTGLFIGRAVSEYKSRFGRGDFLIRNVIGVDRANEAIAVADIIRVGQTIQFHVRDAATAAEDLDLLLDAQKLYDPPAGVLLFTCNGRGSRLFNHSHHDAMAISRAFVDPVGGEQSAKGGKAIAPVGAITRRPIPLAGFFCAGEIGPIDDQVFVHGQTACVALFRGVGPTA